MNIAHSPALIVIRLVWSIRQFEGLAVIWFEASGTRVGVLGWSGILDRYWSNLVLKSSTEHFVIFLIFIGRMLKSIGPLMVKLFSLSDWIL